MAALLRNFGSIISASLEMLFFFPLHLLHHRTSSLFYIFACPVAITLVVIISTCSVLRVSLALCWQREANPFLNYSPSSPPVSPQLCAGSTISNPYSFNSCPASISYIPAFSILCAGRRQEGPASHAVALRAIETLPYQICARNKACREVSVTLLW